MLSEKLYFLEIGQVNKKLWLFKCMTLKTLNSSFLDWEGDRNNNSKYIPLFEVRFGTVKAKLMLFNIIEKKAR